MAKADKPIYTFDIETDPFDGKSDIKPFCCGIYDGNKFYSTWGKDCIKKAKQVLDKLPPGIVYAHNGGKFDMFFCMDWFANNKNMMIINDRIVAGNIWIQDSADCHEFRDSYAIIPMPLKKFDKDEIDYRTFTPEYRRKHKDEILRYLKKDCTSLHNIVSRFIAEFGHNYTIGSTAMKEFKKLHTFECLDAKDDLMIRGSVKDEVRGYYYGGRVQCFEGGIITPTPGEQLIAYDINQCYPNVMRNMLHPVSTPDTVIANEISEETYFVTVYGRNHNAFPVRTKAGLRFDVPHGIFSVSIHEYNAGIETGMFECEDIIECINFDQATKFDKFVDKYHGLRKKAQLENDDTMSLFYKTVGNSAYGKFAQNPDNYYDYVITDEYTDKHDYTIDRYDDEQWEACTIIGMAGFIVWRRRAQHNSRYNVATGASITGGARSLLIRAIANAKRPLYCDTDSMICEGLSGVPIHATELGAWKIEKVGDTLALAGRKMYALFKGSECIKMASKGALLTPEQIVNVAKGNVEEWHKLAPTFDMKGNTMRYLSREIRRTV